MARSSLALLAAVALLATGCATPPDPAPAPVVVAPIPKTYTCAQSRKAANEFMALPADSQLAILISDYSLERKELRAVHGLPDPVKCPPASPATS